MPVYEYLCEACGHQFEELSSMMELLATPCPKCRSDKTRKIMSASAGCGCGNKSAESGGLGASGGLGGLGGLGGGCGSGGFS